MKIKCHALFLTLVLVPVLGPQFSGFAQGTGFTYQGRLNANGNAANGTYDFRFRAATDAGGNNFTGNPSVTNGLPVSNGLFTAAIDFGPGIFTGAQLWLQVEVRTNGGGGYSGLFPLQPLTPSPYAIMAGSASSLVGSLPAAQLSGTLPATAVSGTFTSAVTFNNAANNFSGNGSGLTGLWKLGGNGGTSPGSSFLGTTDNQPLEMTVNGRRALRLEPTIDDANHSNIVNVIGGSALNYVSNGGIGATVSGGGAGNLFGSAYINSVTSDFGTVGGGLQNTSGPFATVGGGSGNTASGTSATVSGGSLNTASGTSAIIPGGDQCTATGDWSFAAGLRAHANHNGAFVWADPGSVGFTSTGVNQFLIRAAGGVGIGLNNPASQLHVSSAGGNPQLQITQTITSDYTRLRMNVLGSPSWEMDVSPGATPGISWWTGSVKMNLDYNGNLTTVGTVNGSSDRNLKEHFSPVSSREVLDKVSSLPITEWNYKTDGTTLRHIGPMAQDFYAAFNVGTDDKHISMVDADGVALAAIQGLNQKLAEQDAALKDQGSEIQKLRQVIVELQETVRKTTNKTQE